LARHASLLDIAAEAGGRQDPVELQRIGGSGHHPEVRLFQRYELRVTVAVDDDRVRCGGLAGGIGHRIGCSFDAETGLPTT
jgi:hypothetical protein